MRLSLLFVGGLTVGTHALGDGVNDLDDAAARMQYAFYTNDVRGLEDALNLVQRVNLPQAMSGMKEYFMAYGNWKIAELHADRAIAGKRDARGAATKAASACVRHAQGATKLDARLAEAYAIEAICSTAGSRTGNSSNACSKHKGLRTALELEPNNPRVRLIEAECAAGGDKPGSTAPIERMKSVLQSFEMAPPSRPGKPDWGQAEALLMFGQASLQRGDTVTARDLIERALIVAPDFRRARDALDMAATRPR